MDFSISACLIFQFGSHSGKGLPLSNVSARRGSCLSSTFRKPLLGGRGGQIFWTVSDAEAGAKVLRKQQDRFFILLRILLDQILHGFYQEPLAFNILGVFALRPLAVAAARGIG